MGGGEGKRNLLLEQQQAPGMVEMGRGGVWWRGEGVELLGSHKCAGLSTDISDIAVTRVTFLLILGL